MRHWSKSSLIILLALLLQFLWRSTPRAIDDLFNFFSIIVVYLALRYGEIAGTLSGTVAGLAQDALSLHVFGLAGLTKTGLGFGVGLAFRKLNLQPLGRQLLILFFACWFELLVWTGLAYLIFGLKAPVWSGTFWLQPLTTALVAGLLFRLNNR